jgi:hypothetical protein
MDNAVGLPTALALTDNSLGGNTMSQENDVPETPSPSPETEGSVPLPDLSDLIDPLIAGGVLGQLSDALSDYPILESVNVNLALNGGQNEIGKPLPRTLELTFSVAMSEQVR